MNLKKFVAELTEQGVKLWAEGEQLRVRAAKGVITPNLRDVLALHKAELVKLLQKQSNASDTSIPQVPASLRRNLPLSFAQEGLWFLSQLEPTNPFYNEAVALRLHGSLNVVALEKSLNKIIQRHEILRTNFAMVEGQPVQVIAQSLTLSVQVLDLGEVPESDREIAWGRKAMAQIQQPFDLSSSGLIRASVLKLTQTEHILLLTIHHIVCDAPSGSLLVRELATFYTAYCNDLQRELPELPIQYADFAVWQRQRLQGDVLESQLAYWKQQLEGAPALLELPTDRVRPSTQTFRGARYRQALSKELTEALMILSRRQKVTLFMTLLAALKTLLYRYTGQSDICVGTPYANRDCPEIEGLIGLFVNTLVLRTDISGNPSFEELLLRVREVALGAYAHADLPFEKLVEQLQPARSLSYTPLCQIMLNLYPPISQIDMDGLTVSRVAVETGTAKFDLSLAFFNTDSGLIGDWEYNTDLFDASTIARMARHFQTLLEAIVANPQQRVSQLPLLTERERHQLLVEWNNTTKEYPQDKCIHQLFEEQVERSPDKVAVVFEDKQLTYRELNQRANRIAHHLRSLGVGPEVLVGICVERSLEMVVGLLGILKAGGAYVPLDPTYPTERLHYMLEDADVQVLLTQARLVESLPKHKARVVCLDSDWEKIAQKSESNPISSVTSNNLAYVIYTSGSTGNPKGVSVPHRAVNRLVLHTNYINLQQKDVVAFASNFSFDAVTFEIWGTLLHGARLVGVSKDVVLSPRNFADLIEKQEISILFLTTALFNQIASVVPSAFHSVQHLLFGGEAVDTRWVKEVLKNGPPQRLLHVYGPTESTTFTTWYLVQDVPEGAKTIPIGRPISNTHCFLLDAQLQPAPIGVPGELYIGGGGLAKGYLNRPDLTQEKFIPNPWSNELGERLYKTGDKARYLPDGNIEFLGRIDNQIKIRGFRIEPGEIEAVISQHPGVQETAVIAREDIPGRKYLAAYIVGDGQSTTIRELRGFLKQRLPDYMIPGAFVILSALPLTPNGKVDRRALPTPEIRPELQFSFIAPRTPIEEMVASIWVSVLGIELVGVHDNFFELGGHSLLATQVMSRVRDTEAVELPLRSLFEAPTVAELASRVEIALKSGQSIQAEPLLPIPRSESIPLSFAQARLWFLDQLQPNSAFYNIPFALRLSGQLNIAAIESSINEVIQRHEALRTNFTTQEGQPVAVIAATLNCQLQVMNLLHIRESDREIEVQRLALVEANRPFNLEREPLLRSLVLHLGETEYVLLFTMHHIISDGWSLGVFTHELTELYKAFCTGITPVLPSLPVQYADFALWQRQWLQGEILEAQLDYWKQQLLDAPALLELPTDRPRPANQTYRGRYHYAALSLELSGKLSALSKRTGVTLFMTLLAAFVTLLSRITSSDDIVIGTPVAGRNRQEIEGLIGFFVNTLVLRTYLGSNPSFEDVLSRVREVALGAYTHQDLPFEQLVEALQPTRSLSYTPLFQVMFALDEKSVPSFELPELTVSSYAVEIGTAKFDLTLSMENTADGLVGVWGYNVDLFDETTIARMAGHFQTLLEGIVANPQQKVSELPLLSEAERHQLLVEWNNTTKEYPFDKCIHQLFEEQVERSPDAIAVVFEDKQLTYRELNQRANCLAHQLRTLGVGPEVLVGICVERSSEMIVGLLGILKAGGAYVPLDPAYPTERLAYMLNDSQVKVLLTQEKFCALLGQIDVPVLSLDTSWGIISQESEENPISDVKPENLAYVIYTSGSTGNPKGVLINHHNVVRLFAATRSWFNFSERDVWTLFHSYAFDFSVWEIVGALIYGGKLVVVPYWVSREPEAFYDLLCQEKVTVLNQTPSAFRQLIKAEQSKETAPNLNLRLVIFGGEALELQSLLPWFERHGDQLPQLVNMYGITETTVHVTYRPLTRADINIGGSMIGSPIPDLQVYILDQNLQPVPIGVKGEIHVGGAGLARGYLNRPDLSASKFIPNPFSDKQGAILYKTGDEARYLSDGNIEYLGRIDHQVKIRGFRIELGEIEAAIAQHPGVRETVVVAREDVPDRKYLAAYIVPNQSEAIASSDLRGFLKQKLPDYMIPSTFIMLSALPLTPNGKVDRRALPKPDTAHQELAAAFVPPRDTVEQQLQRIWSEVLQLPTVGVGDNFFELGGHSLLAVRLMATIEKCFGKNLPLATLFSSSTIEQLAIRLRCETDSLPWSPLVAIQSGGDKRPFFCVPGVGGNVIYLYELARHLGLSQPFYGLQALGLDGESEPFNRVEDIAAYYIEAIQTVQPSGPYLLGGHSFGGVVAFEIATQLQKQGHEVALVAIIDAVAPILLDKKSNGVDVDEAAYLTDFASYVADMLSLDLEVSKEALASFTAVEQLHYLKERLIRVNLLPPDAGITSVRGLVQVFKANYQAYRVYVPSKVLTTKIALFRAQEVDVKESDISEFPQMLKEPALGWKEFSATVSIHVVPGNHMTVMAAPHVQVLAAQLRASLSLAQAHLPL